MGSGPGRSALARAGEVQAELAWGPWLVLPLIVSVSSREYRSYRSRDGDDLDVSQVCPLRPGLPLESPLKGRPPLAVPPFAFRRCAGGRYAPRAVLSG
jgi:hypothetical protein